MFFFEETANKFMYGQNDQFPWPKTVGQWIKNGQNQWV